MLYLAAFLVATLGLAHSYLGEVHLLTRLFRRGGLPPLWGDTALTIGTLRFAWHLTTVLALVVAVLLVQLVGPAPTDQLVRTIGWGLIISGVLPLVFTLGRHLSWLVLFVAGGLCLFAGSA